MTIFWWLKKKTDFSKSLDEDLNSFNLTLHYCHCDWHWFVIDGWTHSHNKWDHNIKMMTSMQPFISKKTAIIKRKKIYIEFDHRWLTLPQLTICYENCNYWFLLGCISHIRCSKFSFYAMFLRYVYNFVFHERIFRHLREAIARSISQSINYASSMEKILMQNFRGFQVK